MGQNNIEGAYLRGYRDGQADTEGSKSLYEGEALRQYLKGWKEGYQWRLDNVPGA